MTKKSTKSSQMRSLSNCLVKIDPDYFSVCKRLDQSTYCFSFIVNKTIHLYFFCHSLASAHPVDFSSLFKPTIITCFRFIMYMLNKCPHSLHISTQGDIKKTHSSFCVRRKAGPSSLKTCWLYGESGSMIPLWPSSGTNKVKVVLWGLIVLAGKWSPALLSNPATSEKGDDCAFPFTPTAWRNVCLFIELPHLVKNYSLSFQLSPQVTG